MVVLLAAHGITHRPHRTRQDSNRIQRDASICRRPPWAASGSVQSYLLQNQAHRDIVDDAPRARTPFSDPFLKASPRDPR